MMVKDPNVMARVFIGIDPGSEKSGVSVLLDGNIAGAWNLKNEDVYNKITPYILMGECFIVIEDMRPYSMRLTMDVIKTCKVIGEMIYRLKVAAGLNVELVSRNEVKKWVFDNFGEAVMPHISQKIAKKFGDKKPTFVFVDDKTVTIAMKHLFQIELPAPGKGYAHGLKEHSWQALAVAAYLCFSTS